MTKQPIASLLLGGLVVALAATGSLWMQRQEAAIKRLGVVLSHIEERIGKLEDEGENAMALARATRLIQRSRTIGEALVAPEQPEERAAAVEPDADSESVPRRPLTQEETAARVETLLASYDRSISNDPDDPRWSVDTLRTAEAQVRSVLPGARIVEARCGGSHCKIVVEHARGDSDPAAAHDLQSLPPFNEGCSLTYTPATTTSPARSRIYLHKPQPGPSAG
jgi:hypothetical protein